MKSIVIYASRYGNTRKVAEVIASTLQLHGQAQVLAVEDVQSVQPEGIDLIVIGGPTEVHRMTQPVAQLFARAGSDAFHGVAVAAFDTRLRGPRVLTGSASSGILHRLRRAGARVIAPRESFFVKNQPHAAPGEGPELEPGELHRAATWADSLAAMLTSPVEASPANIGR